MLAMRHYQLIMPFIFGCWNSLAYAQTFLPPSDNKSEERYFLFHKSDVPIDRARADVAECDGFTQGSIFRRPPTTVNLPANQELDPRQLHLFFGGLVGVAIVGWAVASVDGKIGRASFRHCMMYKGYNRYAVSEGDWKVTMGLRDDDQRIAAVALIASGPLPTVPALVP